MRSLFTLFISTLVVIAQAQLVADFENFGLSTGEFLDGSDLSGGFSSGDIFLPNNYNEDYLSWTGFAISATNDTVTPGFTNQYSAITGGGVDGSDSYAVRYDFVPSIITFNEDKLGSTAGMYVTNSTFAFYSVRDGDAFAKKFGGESGDDPDWFRITFKGYLNGQLTSDSVDFYLADYRSDNNDEDYIVDEWMWVDLSSLGPCDSIWVDMLSSDVGMFGMNTPAYFCIDNVILDPPSSLRNIPIEQITVYPNPVSDRIYLSSLEPFDEVRVIDSEGRIVIQDTPLDDRHSIDVSRLATGFYEVFIAGDGTFKTGKFIKG